LLRNSRDIIQRLRQDGFELANAMTHYIGLIHKEKGSGYGVSFPDLPGVVASADDLVSALEEAASALAFAAQDWPELTGMPFPIPRSLESLREDAEFCHAAADAVVAAVRLEADLGAAA
jgi:predicted RNase H-like HicB family nuclease